ncbi:MAG: peptidoglycan DD-metalloendopeptidase family protein [Patescibacteria group bacterium]
MFSFLSIGIIYAQTASELQNKITDKSKEIEALEKEIDSYRKQLDTVGKEANTLSRAIKELDLNRKKLTVDIKVTENKIYVTNLRIQELSKQIVGKENNIDENKLALQSGLKNIQELDANNNVELLLSQNNFFDAWKQIESIQEFQNKVRDKILSLREIKKDLEDSRSEEEKAKMELVELKAKLADQKKIVDQNAKEKQQLLTKTKNKESNYKKLLAQKEASMKAFEDELRNYEEKLKFILDPSKLPGQGILSWPLDNIYITQKFGKTVAAKRLYVSGSHSGVDFRASMGTPVKAAASGIVEGTGNTDLICPGSSFGKWIFIRHGNGLATTYSHLSLIKVNVGDRVLTGQIIGYSGNTGYSTAPHLDLKVYASDGVKVENRPSKSCGGKVYTMPVAAINAYLDPFDYLPAYTASMVKPDL